ncbi:MAG: methyltransferase domain-containing protein [Anaerolineae bacterium]
MLHQHPSPNNRHPSIAAHLGLLLLAVVILAALYAISQSVSAVGAGGIVLVAAHLAAAAGLFLVGRRLLRGLINTMHGPVQHTHPHDELETTGERIRWASRYDAFVQLVTFGTYNKLQGSVVTLARIQPGEQVLDVGCGTGKLVIAAKRAVPRATLHGRDAAPEMIERARQNASQAHVEIGLKASLIEAIDFPDNSLDVVMSSFVIHHLPDDLKTKAFAEIYRVLKPGGRHLVVEFEPPRKWATKLFLGLLLGKMVEINTQEIPPLLEKAGFVRIETGNAGNELATYFMAHKPV